MLLHPIFVALAPVVFLYAHNAKSFPATVMLVPGIAALVATLGLWWILTRALRSPGRAAVVVTIVLVGFGSYGPLVYGLDRLLHTLPHPLLVRRWAIGIGGIVGLVWALRTRRDLTTIHRFLNVVTGTFVGLGLVRMAFTAWLATAVSVAHTGTIALPAPAEGPPRRDLPDIYYIVLDGFAREDVLRDLYAYSPSSLYEYLRREGFFVADRSFANYCQTLLSMAATLNATHLVDLTDRREQPHGRLFLSRMIRDNEVVRLLRERGYRWVAYDTDYSGLDISRADVVIEPPRQWWHVTEFQSGLLNTTLYCPIERRLHWIPGMRAHLKSAYAGDHRSRILHALENLKHSSRGNQPTFTYTHLIVPHPPFVFEANGSVVDDVPVLALADGNHLHGYHPALQSWYRKRYSAQIEFIEPRIIEVLDAILSLAGPQPIIILQSDHGPGMYLSWESHERTNMTERFGILNAYRLPPDSDTLLYPEITPVNSFRIILHALFGGTLQLKEDRSYYSAWKQPYDFVDVTDQLREPVTGTVVIRP